MNEFIKISKDNNRYIELDKSCYSSHAIDSTIYHFSSLCVIVPQNINDKTLQISFYPLPLKEASNLDTIVADFYRELSDQQIRSELEVRFADIRNIIVKKAFSNFNK
jgi:His-Xaa-Ser system protein HxsD